jgi:hypothetical protein
MSVPCAQIIWDKKNKSKNGRMNLPYSHIFQFTVCKHSLIVITLKKHYIQSEVFFQVERFRAIATAKAQHARASQGRTTLAGDPNKKNMKERINLDITSRLACLHRKL